MRRYIVLDYFIQHGSGKFKFISHLYMHINYNNTILRNVYRNDVISFVYYVDF